MATKRRKARRQPAVPKYDFPGPSKLLLLLIALAVLTLLGTIAASSDTAQTMAHGTVIVQEAQP